MTPAQERRLERLAQHLHSLGPRAVHELLAELAVAHSAEDDLFDRLERFRRLSPDTTAAFGGDRFPPRQPVAVPR